MKKQILLVEYDLATIEVIKSILSNPIFEVTIAEEGELAKKLLENKTFDLLISAAMLPKFHGFNLSLHVAKNFPSTKIIIISGVYKGLDYKHQAVTQYQANAFYEKPLNPKEFKKAVLDMLYITEEDLKSDAKGSSTRIPVADTKKIPTLETIEKDDGNQKQLSSEDIFGDIIENVEKVPSHEINLDDKNQSPPPSKSPKKEEKVSPAPKEVPPEHKEPISGILDKTPRSGPIPTLNQQPVKSPLVDLESRDSDILLKQKMSDLDSLAKFKELKNDSKNLQKIEDEISQKFEDTLSGLGLGSKKKTNDISPPPPQKESAPPEAPKPPPAPTRPLMGKDEIGGYDILGLIARGGMAEIYKAKKKGVKGFEKILAIKKILSGYGEDDRYIEMFVDEAKIAAELSHPNIVQIYDLGKKDDYYFIAMEFVQGKDLRLILRQLKESNQYMPQELSIHLIIKILTALNYAHTAKDKNGKNLDIVHRDISPPNILVGFNGDIKLTDFGVSKASNKIHQTIAGALKGKLLYMSPEQARGESNIDHRADIYSVGIILFELLTGEKLFLDSTEMQVLKKVQNGIVTEPSSINKDIDPELEKIVMKCLHKDQGQRYPNASSMIKDLEAYMINHFERNPDSLHIAHFLYNLFKKDIKEEGIRIDLKPIPYEIKKKIQKKVETQEPKKEKPLAPSPKSDPPPSAPLVEEISLIEKDEMTEPSIEIELDKTPGGFLKEKEAKDEPKIEPKKAPEPVKQKPMKEKEPPSIDIGRDFFKEKPKKKSAFLLYIFAAIIILVIAIYFIYKEKFVSDPIEMAQNKAAKTKTIPISKDSGLKINQSGAVNVPAGEKDPTIISNQPADSAISPTQEETVSPKITQKTTPAVEKDKPPVPKEKPKEEKKKEIQSPSIEKKKDPTEEKPVTSTPLPKEKPTPAEEEKKPQTDSTNLETPAKTTTAPTEQTEDKVPVQQQPIQQIARPSIKEGQVLSINEVDIAPKPVSTPTPKIPQNRFMRVTTTVVIRYLIDHKGNVEKVVFIRKSNRKNINDIIENTIKKWKYKPAVKNNLKVKIWKTISFKVNQ